MAFDHEGNDSETNNRKRKRRKLLVHEKVEVRSVEEGFEGSWHPATVIACDYQVRHVKYDHILNENGCENLVEIKGVSPIIEGSVAADEAGCKYRGIIRPWPPLIEFGKWCLPYGLCVDAWYNEAWWEGVIFDQEDGSEERMVFFPDIGDEISFEIDKLRITQDWNEVTESWERRGNWLFLELIEEYEQENPLFVSVKQIWYDLREKKGFERVKEWTCSKKSTWKILVLESINDNLAVTLNELNRALEIDGHLVPEIPALSELPEPTPDVTLEAQEELAKICAIVPAESNWVENGGLAMEEAQADLDGLIYVMDDDRTGKNGTTNTSVSCHVEVRRVQNQDLPVMLYNSDQICNVSFNTTSEDGSSTSSDSICNGKSMPTNWQPAGPDIVPGPMFCPDAVTEYAQAYLFNRKPGNTLATKVRMHLSYLGWELWSTKFKNSFRMRYITPSGKSYYSLFKICEEWEELSTALSPISQDFQRSLMVSPNDLSSSPRIEQPQVREEQRKLPPPSESDDLVPQYCPQAVVNWINHAKNKEVSFNIKQKMSLKAKKHLLAVGWVFSYKTKSVINGKEKNELRYNSPRENSRCYNTLLAACQACIDEGGVSEYKATTWAPMESNKLSYGVTNMEFEGSLVGQISHCRLDGLNSDKKWVHPKVANLPKSKKGKVSGALVKLPYHVSSSYSSHVLRSSKRARQAVAHSSSTHCPRTVLSWLIDNNVVLPREKVQYRDRKDYPTAEGRITRDGIKCNCCQKVFTLSAFETHAGSTYRRPAANIFLADGRSLLECQVQMVQNNTRAIKTELCDRPKSYRRQPKNDNICSVCHYGGELILCDQCPSSFHKTCIGLQDVPEGDWFCQSCCCAICGQRNFEEKSEYYMDDDIRNCDQCEHQYHIGCLRKRGLLKLESYPEGNWFCNKKCRKIFFGLQKLLGKQVAVGVDNLTWTLQKSRKYSIADSVTLDIEGLAESYSKLNVALGVMHECFEPVKEARTRRDLVEDIIFSKGSDLNRLNFQGFYTVLLEKNDELISVATIRVFGEKVAEVPLVATRFQYRRMGMCHFLIDELEKKLVELGVERLILPAVPSVLNTWTTSFGFSKMTASERLEFLRYTFLDFQGTVMCQKILKTNPSAEASILRGIQHKACDEVEGGDANIDIDGHSSISEVFQAERIDQSEIVDQRYADTLVGNCSHGSSTSPSSMVVAEGPATPLRCLPWYHEKSLECSDVDANHKNKGECNGNANFKFYKRRRVLTSEAEPRSTCPDYPNQCPL